MSKLLPQRRIWFCLIGIRSKLDGNLERSFDVAAEIANRFLPAARVAQGQIALAHRTRLRGAERRTRISALRSSRVAWLSPPRDTLHRSSRLSYLRTGGDSPLSLLAAQDASVTQRLSTPWRRRSDPNVTSKTRSRRSENISPSRLPRPSRDVHVVFDPSLRHHRDRERQLAPQEPGIT